jgi:DNA mismatch repair protein MutS
MGQIEKHSKIAVGLRNGAQFNGRGRKSRLREADPNSQQLDIFG